MAEGYKAILKLAAPPVKEYHSGASIILQGETMQEVADTVSAYLGKEVGDTIVRHIFEVNLQPAIQKALSGAPSLEPTGSQAEELPAPTGDGEVATANLLKAVSNKTGKPVEELAGLSRTEAMSLLKGR